MIFLRFQRVYRSRELEDMTKQKILMIYEFDLQQNRSNYNYSNKHLCFVQNNRMSENDGFHSFI
jgi:hypothetical protein